jgi:hypothetical protein
VTAILGVLPIAFRHEHRVHVATRSTNHGALRANAKWGIQSFNPADTVVPDALGFATVLTAGGDHRPPLVDRISEPRGLYGTAKMPASGAAAAVLRAVVLARLAAA